MRHRFACTGFPKPRATSGLVFAHPYLHRHWRAQSRQVGADQNVGKVLLVVHFIAGEELTWSGTHDPERFLGLIYLDAAYDRSSDCNAPAMVRLRELTGASRRRLRTPHTI
jgi:hypothetical protein